MAAFRMNGQRSRSKIGCANVSEMSGCPFCGSEEIPFAENDVAMVIGDKRPISPGHSLVIPKRHVTSIFALSMDDYLACFALVRTVQELLESRHSPAGFNVVVNNGTAAG